MRYSNELKVGLSLIIAAVIFILGIRYFEDIPIFKGTYDLYTEFDNARGLVSGNAVTIRGVKVGSVEEVGLDPASNRVRVRFHVNTDIVVPTGSHSEVTGIDALSAVQLTIVPGPASNPAIEPGGRVPAREGTDVFAEITDRAPVLMGRVDSVLIGLDATLGDARELVQDDSDLRALLLSLRRTAASLDALLAQERDELSAVLANMEAVTSDLSRITSESGDSITVAINEFNRVLERLNRNLASLERTTAGLDAVIGKIDRGEGTLGLLVNDPTLYHRLDSTVTSMNDLLIDLRENPVRYFRALRLVDLF